MPDDHEPADLARRWREAEREARHRGRPDLEAFAAREARKWGSVTAQPACPIQRSQEVAP